eukprot:scaffold14.g1022.t1
MAGKKAAASTRLRAKKTAATKPAPAKPAPAVTRRQQKAAAPAPEPPKVEPPSPPSPKPKAGRRPVKRAAPPPSPTAAGVREASRAAVRAAALDKIELALGLCDLINDEGHAELARKWRAALQQEKDVVDCKLEVPELK